MIRLLVSYKTKPNVSHIIYDEVYPPRVGEHILIQKDGGKQDVCEVTMVFHGYQCLTDECSQVYAEYIRTIEASKSRE